MPRHSAVFPHSVSVNDLVRTALVAPRRRTRPWVAMAMRTALRLNYYSDLLVRSAGRALGDVVARKSTGPPYVTAVAPRQCFPTSSQPAEHCAAASSQIPFVHVLMRSCCMHILRFVICLNALLDELLQATALIASLPCLRMIVDNRFGCGPHGNTPRTAASTPCVLSHNAAIMFRRSSMERVMARESVLRR